MAETKNIETKEEPIVTETNEPTKEPTKEPEGLDVDKNDNKSSIDLEVELRKLKNELAEEKKKSDALARENKEKKNLLRSMQSEEERKAAEKEEREEAMRVRLAELERQSAVATASKKVMSFVEDEASATSIAEALYGADDIDLAIDEIARAWNNREKKLKAEYERIPHTLIGSEDAPPITREEIRQMSYKQRADFQSKYPEKYASLMQD